MSDSIDIPAITDFQKGIVPLQLEYKTALKTRIHPDKDFDKAYQLNFLSFDHKCQVVYEHKIRELSWKIIEAHRESKQSYIDLINYPKFKDLVYASIWQTYTFLDTI